MGDGWGAKKEACPEKGSQGQRKGISKNSHRRPQSHNSIKHHPQKGLAVDNELSWMLSISGIYKLRPISFSQSVRLHVHTHVKFGKSEKAK